MSEILICCERLVQVLDSQTTVDEKDWNAMNEVLAALEKVMFPQENPERTTE